MTDNLKTIGTIDLNPLELAILLRSLPSFIAKHDGDSVKTINKNHWGLALKLGRLDMEGK